MQTGWTDIDSALQLLHEIVGEAIGS